MNFNKMHFLPLIFFFFISISFAQWSKNESEILPGNIGYIQKVSFIDSLNGWFITNYQLFHTIDGGANWSEQVVYSQPT